MATAMTRIVPVATGCQKGETPKRLSEIKKKSEAEAKRDALDAKIKELYKTIEANPELVYEYTNKWNTVIVVSDGTRVLGLGDIGPKAGLPVMEGKAMLFKEFADIDAWPICIASQTVRATSSTMTAALSALRSDSIWVLSAASALSPLPARNWRASSAL